MKSNIIRRGLVACVLATSLFGDGGTNDLRISELKKVPADVGTNYVWRVKVEGTKLGETYTLLSANYLPASTNGTGNLGHNWVELATRKAQTTSMVFEVSEKDTNWGFDTNANSRFYSVRHDGKK